MTPQTLATNLVTTAPLDLCMLTGLIVRPTAQRSAAGHRTRYCSTHAAGAAVRVG